ncbi:MAG TPA: amylo-alpha-1,6-glucosidase, partial [Chryseosolibacter sp.]|nr:amylo-alpha-1,6-glucosidase [Chryseosolibacter sp.]
DQFIATRDDGLKTIIAGYPWFSDWGRDTMIALPGLCLATGRFDDAKKILRAFAGSVSQGMLPNRFVESGEGQEYNTVDATLWFFHALFKYHQYTKDDGFVSEIIPVLKEIIEWHYSGTRFNIRVDADGLLSAGQEGVQLTWMDAKVGDWVVTPRTGKPVEINALWFNALSIMSAVLKHNGDKALAGSFAAEAAKVRIRFNELYWNETQGCLFDCVDGDRNVSDMRPNQLYAVALPFDLLRRDRGMSVLSCVREKLLTPVGLRSLSRDHPDYRPSYRGDTSSRDSAYHQGTVWSHLLGIYVDAVMRIEGDNGRRECTKLLTNFLPHLDEGGIGSVSEIFDGDPPYKPGGCIAQAWSVAEILRTAVEYNHIGGRRLHTQPGA